MIEGIRTASPNNAVERTAGSHSLAAAAHRERSTHVGRYLRLGAFSVAIVVLLACSARLPDRSETAMACPSISTDNHYFPIGFLEDRKSTRLNSSHGYISYAVFCLKKKKKQKTHRYIRPRKYHRSISAVHCC